MTSSTRELSPDVAPATILAAVRRKKTAWVSYLKDLVSVESPTDHPPAQAPVQARLAESLEDLGFSVRYLRGREGAGSILATPQRRAHGPFQLLLGHTDTVWPLATLDTMPVEVTDSVVRGPGAFDMKSGLTNIVVALTVLEELGLEPEVPPVVLINSDEETGSRESTRHIRRLGRLANRVFVLEPALGPEGRIKTARKGTGTFSVRVVGVGTHAGLDPERGASAIQELSLVIQSIHQLSDHEKGITVNVGWIQGGIRSNIVAPEARADVDVRVTTQEQGPWIEEQIRAIEPRVDGCRIEVTGGMVRPPFERTASNQRLWQEARRKARELGLALEEGMAGGASDGNTTSLTTPTLDGLGGVGDGAHASHEYVDIESSLERCALLAALLLMPSS